MTSAVSLQLDSKDLGEQLTKLFPKCRPRDLNLNHLHGHDSRLTLDNNAFVMELKKEMTRWVVDSNLPGRLVTNIPKWS